MTTLAPDRAGPTAGPTAAPTAGPEPARGPKRRPGPGQDDGGTRAWLRRRAVSAWMNVLIAGTAAITVLTAGITSGHPWPEPGTWGTGALKLFALWCLSFLPGWLYVRFLDLRAKALWSEYVLNLHRLSWDMPWNLPKPPRDSTFYQRWDLVQQSDSRPEDNIYRQKFEAYYGRQITDATDGPSARRRGQRDSDEDYRVRS